MLAFAPASSGLAAVATGTLLVSAMVLDTCTVVATPLAFGSLLTLVAATELAPSVVSLVCTAAKPSVTVTLDGGANPSGGMRHMSDGGAGRVPYRIYTDSGHSSAVAIGGQVYSGSVAAITPTAIGLYGTIGAGIYTAGVYGDAVTITVNY